MLKTSFSQSTSLQAILRISDRRMAVSNVNRTQGAIQGLRPDLHACSTLSSSPGNNRRSRELPVAGFLMDRTGLSKTSHPHSLMATSNACWRIHISRLTVTPCTVFSRWSRYFVKGAGETSDMAIWQKSCRSIALTM